MKKLLLFILVTMLLLSLVSCKAPEKHYPQTEPPENNILTSDTIIYAPDEETTTTANPAHSSPEQVTDAYINALLNSDAEAYIELLTAPEKAISAEHNGDIKWNRFNVMLQNFNAETPYDKTSFHTETVTDNKLTETDLSKYTASYNLHLLSDKEKKCAVSEGRELDVVVELSSQNNEKIARSISLILLNENGKWKIHRAIVLPPNLNF